MESQKNVFSHLFEGGIKLGDASNLMKGSDLVLDYVHLSHYGCHKIIFKPSRPSIDFLDWKKATINPINKEDNKFFQHVVKVTLNHEKIKKPGKNNKNL